MGQTITLVSNFLSGIFRVPRFIKADMSGPAAQFVKEAIAKNKVIIFSKSYCPYCTIAKETFQKLSFPAVTIELENRDDCNQIQAVLGEMTGATSVPRVFVDGKFIGGGTEVKKLYETGQLQKLLA
ncbi:glutaredoxin-C4-like [Bradysia coprophila]|uniref:glutaredoxin-C4-like n=1 Tax=Bradysia coprophila TaxID=38358 RepID=UPI00187D8DF1|nr:glutaredoxin-C4-like [Bradysia coprophila]